MSDVPKDSEDFDAERATEKLARLIQDATGVDLRAASIPRRVAAGSATRASFWTSAPEV